MKGATLAKYAVFFTYSSDAWARMIDNPGDRAAAVRQLADTVPFNVSLDVVLSSLAHTVWAELRHRLPAYHATFQRRVTLHRQLHQLSDAYLRVFALLVEVVPVGCDRREAIL